MILERAPPFLFKPESGRRNRMDTPSPAIRDVARRLLSAGRTDSNSQGHNAAIVIEKLRMSVTRFAGAEGFASLLRRAVILASRDVPSLHPLEVAMDGRLKGWEHLGTEMGMNAARVRDEAAVEIAANLLELLVTFIGEALTLNLVRGTWPETSPGE